MRLTDTTTGADNSIHANNATGSLSYFADFNNEVASSAHDWYIDNTGATLRMRLNDTGLGIGKSPSATVHAYSGSISAASEKVGLRLGAAFGDAAAKHAIAWYAADDATRYASIVQGLSASGNGGTISLRTKSDAGSDAEKMLLDEAGDVTIKGGVSAPGQSGSCVGHPVGLQHHRCRHADADQAELARHVRLRGVHGCVRGVLALAERHDGLRDRGCEQQQH
jgi:hypothetical protein